MGDTTTVPDSEEEFARASDSSGDLDRLLWEPISTAAVARSHPGFDERVLDAGSGGGASAVPTAELVGPGGHVDAVDVDESVVEAARERSGCGSARARASSTVGATDAFTVRNVIGAGCRSLGRYSVRYSSSARSIPSPEKWLANTYGSPSCAASFAE